MHVGSDFLFSLQFACSRDKLKECVAEELNTSVNLCLLHNLTKTAEDGLTLCLRQTMPCHFPEVRLITFKSAGVGASLCSQSCIKVHCIKKNMLG